MKRIIQVSSEEFMRIKAGLKMKRINRMKKARPRGVDPDIADLISESKPKEWEKIREAISLVGGK